MHELSIALGIIDVAAEEAARHGARVVTVHVQLGPLSGVVGPALQSAFELAREDTSLSDSRLVIEELPITVHCPTCDVPRQVVSIQELCCTVCGTFSADVLTGRELEVTTLELTS